jgi:hypothetical protein
LKQKHGRTLLAVEAPDGSTIVVRKPTKEEWADFTDSVIRDKTNKHACMERYVLSCAVHPERERVAGVLAEYPPFVGAISVEINKLAGASDELSVKKL